MWFNTDTSVNWYHIWLSNCNQSIVYIQFNCFGMSSFRIWVMFISDNYVVCDVVICSFFPERRSYFCVPYVFSHTVGRAKLLQNGVCILCRPFIVTTQDVFVLNKICNHIICIMQSTHSSFAMSSLLYLTYTITTRVKPCLSSFVSTVTL